MSSRSVATPRKIYPLPSPRSGGMHFHDADGDDAPACGAAGAVALESVRNGCQGCAKLRLRLQHEERARVKAQEQLAKLQVSSLQLRKQVADSAAAEGVLLDPARPVSSPGSKNGSVQGESVDGDTGNQEAAVLGEVPNTGAAQVVERDDVARSLESYRREVAILRDALRARDERDAASAQQQRDKSRGYESAKQEWEAQVAGLVCEVQDLEARNRELEEALQAVTAKAPVTDGTRSLKA